MTEPMIVEAVRAAGGAQAVLATAAPAAAPDPAAIARFEAAMASEGPRGMPFVSEVSETIAAAQDAYQVRVHRLETLAATMGGGHTPLELMELQYEVAALSFQQEVVTNVAKKASDAITTLVKNG